MMYGIKDALVDMKDALVDTNEEEKGSFDEQMLLHKDGNTSYLFGRVRKRALSVFSDLGVPYI
eukprot:scaffold6506_cov171-Amphora_coffeaeformis.AAC.25